MQNRREEYLNTSAEFSQHRESTWRECSDSHGITKDPHVGGADLENLTLMDILEKSQTSPSGWQEQSTRGLEASDHLFQPKNFVNKQSLPTGEEILIIMR